MEEIVRQSREDPSLHLGPNGRWDTKNLVTKWNHRGHDAPISSVGFDKTGDRLVSGSEDGSVVVWTTDTGTETTRLKAHKAAVERIQFGPLAGQLVSSGDDDATTMWDLQTSAARWSVGGGGRIGVAFSPDGLYVATGGPALSLWDSSTGRQIATFGVPGDNVRIVAIAFSDDGKWIASGAGGAIRLWKRSN
jgi:WD40 repeat protein